MKPVYKRASYTGDFLELKNENISLRIFKRLCGWGFGEVCSADGRLMAVLDHFGEILLRDQEIPMRLEAEDYESFSDGDRSGFVFKVSTTLPAEKLRGTSFEKWVHFPFNEPVLSGTVKICLRKGDTGFGISTELVSNGNYYARYLRLLWLLCGEGSFGSEKCDALLPGVDWPVGREWSGGTDFFKDPWAGRSIPHPNKVASSYMGVSCGGRFVSVHYDLDAPVTRWFNYDEIYPQPVFACPNYIDRSDNNLLGIMIPDVKREEDENKPFRDDLELHIGQRISFGAEIHTGAGDSLDGLAEYVKRSGMPVPDDSVSLRGALDVFARAYNTNLWHEGRGFGYRQASLDNDSELSLNVPGFLRRYVSENEGSALSSELSAKIAYCDGRTGRLLGGIADDAAAEKARREGDRILARQQDDGSFRFEPEGEHYSKDDFRVARAFIEPMGIDGDTALYMNTEPANSLMTVYETCGDRKYLDGAIRALRFCTAYNRPEGGDFWETPLHAPNLLAAGSAVCAFYRAFKITGEAVFKEKSVRFLRSLLAFTHLRRPRSVNSLYNTKPCLCSSDWYFANWVRDFVQWEVLRCLNQSYDCGALWHEIDPELDWKSYEIGVTSAVMHFVADTGKALNWRPHNIPATLDNYLKGEYNGCFADTLNSVTGNIGGMFIPPVSPADAIYKLIDEFEL
ncbi:MAG: hypothetical protein ILO53_06135 [Clostridia bacterium]|nr:hypothetical protein [Clostridia bacterium]